MSGDDSVVPRVIVFDLDGTLWDPEMYQLWGGGSPFKPHKKNPSVMIDRAGTEVHLIGESREVLQTLSTDARWASTYLAISSTCDEPSWAEELLGKFTFTDAAGKSVPMASLFGDRIEIYKANKAKQHETILKKVNRVDASVTDYGQMLFFDNQTDNVRYVSAVGVPSCYCSSGMTKGTFERGLEMWRRAQSSKM
ncbi:Acid Phosphatase [Novymonas esmeraldas]|uniref:Acid Phosphatase n=1 Tax=Novymonas esmeraldas TaxID=1808958 RepID=A0AAW0F479_9TRYP